MLCQMCLRAEATFHLVDRVRGEPPVESDYCPTCYDLKYVHPPARPPDFPRPRFTIKRLMILAAVFAIPNAAVALVMRSGLIPGTPAQLRDWTFQGFLFANVVCGMMAVHLITIIWLQKAMWHQRTGSLIPMSKPRKLGSRGNLILLARVVPLVAGLLAGSFAVERLAPIVWPGWRPDAAASMWIALVPLWVWLGLRIRSRTDLSERFRVSWRSASRRERFFLISGVLWLVFFLFFLSRPYWVFWSGNPLISLSVMMAVGLGGQLVLLLGLVASIRRR